MTLRDALVAQATHCAALDSPFMARLLPILAEVWPHGSELDADILAYDGDIGPKGHSLPLRLASGLHALVLTGQDPALTAAYPPNQVSDAALRDVVWQALTTQSDFLRDWITSPPQTNEVRRSAALIAGAHTVAALTGVTDIHLSELGASGGLNLMFDHYALETGDGRLGPVDAALTLAPDWSGPSPDPTPLTVHDRRGVDLNPLNPRNPADALRLRAYLWADQPNRLALTEAAIAASIATVDRGDAVDWLENRLKAAPQDQVHLITHTIAWQYFPAGKQTRGTTLIEAAGARATSTAPLAWLRMEADDKTRGAALTARLWPGDHHLDLGRIDFHGRWVDWHGVPA